MTEYNFWLPACIIGEYMEPIVNLRSLEQAKERCRFDDGVGFLRRSYPDDLYPIAFSLREGEMLDFLTTMMRDYTFGHHRKLELFYRKHSGDWNNDALDLRPLMTQERVNFYTNQGWWYRGLWVGAIEGEGGLIDRMAAGADWLQGKGQDTISDAIARGHGTREQIRQRLLNRIATTANPIAADASIDDWPPVMTVTQYVASRYYAERAPGFVAEDDREPDTSVFLSLDVMDESEITLRRNGEIAGLDPGASGMLNDFKWLRDGQSVTWTAIDASGNEATRSFSNTGGVITENPDVSG